MQASQTNCKGALLVSCASFCVVQSVIVVMAKGSCLLSSRLLLVYDITCYKAQILLAQMETYNEFMRRSILAHACDQWLLKLYLQSEYPTPPCFTAPI